MRKGRLIALLALAAVPGVVYWLVAFDLVAAEQRELFSEIVATAGFSYVIAALIVTTATLREERDAGTLPYIYMRPMLRVSLAGSSLIAGAIAAVTIALGGWLVLAAAAVAIGVGFSVALPSLALFVAAALGYAGVFVPLGYLVPRSLLVGLGYVIVLESILAGAITGLAQISIWRISLSIYAGIEDVFGPAAQEILGPVTPGIWGGVIKIGAVLLIGLAVLTWALRRRDAL